MCSSDLNTATAIQYTHARIQAISRKASQLNISGSLEFQPSVLKKSERELLIHLLNFEAMIMEAADGYSPAVVANYLYETSRKYNSFFAAETIFQAETPDLVQFRVSLSVLTGRTIRTCGNILGIEMPERM